MTRTKRKVAIVFIVVAALVLLVYNFYYQERTAIVDRRFRYYQTREDEKTNPENSQTRNGMHNPLSHGQNEELISGNVEDYNKDTILQPSIPHTKIKSNASNSNKRVPVHVSGTDLVHTHIGSKERVSTNSELKSTSQTRTLYDDASGFIDIEQHVPDLDILFKRTVIVTAISDNHFGEAKGMIASAQRYMPHNKIVVYDLGLSPRVIKKISEICNVELRSFPSEKYPPHVKNVHTYAWKPLIILETLKEFGAVFYGDSSVRFLNSLRILYPYLKQNHGFIQHIHHFDPRPRDAQYHMTHPDTFRELGVDRTAYAKDIGFTPWISAGRVLHVNSSYMHEKVLGPLVECSLRPECISPKGGHRGSRGNKGEKHSHRFDSSVLSLLVYKNMRGFYNADNNSTELFDKVVKIERRDFSVHGLKTKPHNNCN